ncbi:MAG TPA: DNA helicase RecQ [Cryomorphaceae bacterium]|nr:DNA helicase RecQ [Cryomorphaceae bacterium]
METKELSVQQHLKKFFGFDNFKGNQEAVVKSIIGGNDTFVIMPTGGGKSLCYQLPALMQEGTAIVVSPLIALMKNQVDSIRGISENNGVAHVLNSSLTKRETDQVKSDIIDGTTKLLYVAPESLTKEENIEFLQQSTVSFFAIDEAHCISEWGHDFRPEYRNLRSIMEKIGRKPVIALTATATPKVQNDIQKNLGMENARVFKASFNRPNLYYEVRPKTKNVDRDIIKFIKGHMGKSGIIYCLSRKKVEELSQTLQVNGIKALPYHAGLDAKSRVKHQDDFLMEEVDVIVATIAFGMGIDKPDVRFIAHLDLPKSLEAYYQETGRAGRDGEPATAWMAYGLQDVIKLRQMLETSRGSEEHKRSERHKLNAMLGLCEITSCRRHALLHYFGENSPERCGNCDTCLSPVETWDGTLAAQKAFSCIYRTGQRFGVNHLIDVLRGIETDKVQQFGHQNLSTFGLGQDLDNTQWHSVFRQLVARGYLKVDMEGFGSLLLAEKCRPSLRGEESVSLRRDTREKVEKKARGKRKLAAADQPLWDALSGRRKALSEEFGVPPYIIFHDATLMEFLHHRPQTPSQLLKINGVGQSKLERYGDTFLEVIREFEAASRNDSVSEYQRDPEVFS